MPNCPNCSYKLVLLSSRSKYKCALCSKLYPEREIEAKEFQKLNKRLRINDIENYEKEKKEYQARIGEIKKDLRLLFNGFSKVNKREKKVYYEQNKERIRQLNKEWRLRNREYDLNRKQEYRIKNKEIIKVKDKLRLLNNPESVRLRQNKWRRDNRAIMRTYGMIQHYRTKQKALALQYLSNDTYSPPSDNPFYSVPTLPLSYLLLAQKTF